MSEREDEIARGVARALQERDAKKRLEDGVAGVFAISFIVLLFVVTLALKSFGAEFLTALSYGFIASLVLSIVLAVTVAHRAKQRTDARP